MHERSNDFNSLGICQRLFNFMNNLIARSLRKRITLGQPLPQGRSTHLMQKSNGDMMVHYQDHEKSKDHYSLGSEIPIQFKQSERLESWTPVDKLGSSIYVTGEGDPIAHADQPQLKKDDSGLTDNEIWKKQTPLVQANGTSKFQVQEKTKGSQLQGKSSQVTGPKESEEEEKIRKKGKSIVSDQNLTLAIEEEDNTTKITPRRLRPPLTVAPNINQKSEEFIRQKRASMNKN